MYDFDKVNKDIKQLQNEIDKQTNILMAEAKIFLFTLQKINEAGGLTNANNSKII